MEALIGGVFHVECRDADGRLEWERDAPNFLAQNATDFLRNVLFGQSTYGPTTLAAAPYIALLDGIPSPYDALYWAVTGIEASNAGYSRQQPIWTSTEGPSGANNLAHPVTWTAIGSPIALTGLLLTDAASGTVGNFISYANVLSGTINVGATLYVTYTFSVS